MPRTRRTGPRRRSVVLVAALAVAAGGATLVAGGDAPAAAATPLTLRTISIDGSFDDWDAVLANPLQTTRDGDGSSAAIKADCGAYSTDRDCPLAGGAGNDFLTFAWTYDATHVYLFIERYGSASNTVDFLFVADVNRDRRLALADDAVVGARWFGSNTRIDLSLFRYGPADAVNGDPIACEPLAPAARCANAAGVPAAPEGYVDGYKLPGANVPAGSCAGCVGQGGADGTRAELAIPWSTFGATVDRPFFWHAVSSNNGSLAGAVDNIGAPSGRLGSFVHRGVSLGPDHAGAIASPGQASWAHLLANEGNDEDLFDLAAASSQGARVDVLEGEELLATDATGDGTWDWIAPGRDESGDGRPDVRLLAGGARELTVRVTLPAGRAGVEVTELTAASAAEPFVRDTATGASQIGTAAFVPASQRLYTVAGQPLPFRDRLRNAQAVPEAFEVVADAGCAGFRVELAADEAGSPGATLAVDEAGDGAWDGGAPGLGPVAPGGELAFHLVVTPPAGAPAGASCAVTLAATSTGTGAAASSRHEVVVTDPVTFAPDHRGAVPGLRDPADAQVATGSSIFLPATLRNAEATARAYDLAVAVSGGAGASARVWSDPDGDGNPSDGAIVARTDVLAPYGGAQHVVVEVRAGSALPGSLLVAAATAQALEGGAAATQVSEVVVGFVAAYADPLLTDAANAFAPCATVYVGARGLAPGDVTRYALAWAPPSGDAPPPVAPWPTTAIGTASAELALAADAALGPWAARLLESGGPKDEVAFSVELSGSIPALAVERARYRGGEAVRVTAAVRNDGAARLDDTALAYAGAVSRTRALVDVAAGETLGDTFTFQLPADAAPGVQAVTLGWRLSCAASPFAAATATFEVAPPPPAVTSPSAGARLPDATPLVEGTGLPGATVIVSVTGAASSPPVPVDGAGRWSWTVPSALADGPHEVVAAQTAGGVEGDPSAPIAFAIDATPPAPPVIDAPATGTLANDAEVAVSGTAADPEALAVELLVDGAPVATRPVVGGTFSALLVLEDGIRVLAARALDDVGNASPPSNEVSVTVDTVAPAAPTLALVGATPTRASPVPLTGTAEAHAQVEILAGAAVLAAVAADGQGSFSAALPLPEGAHELVARATDAAGNAGPDSAPARFAVDRTAPPLPVVAVPADGALLSAADTLGGAVTVAGGAEPGALVELEVTGVPQPAALASGAGAFSVTVALADGTHLARARARDDAGNESGWSAPVSFALDTVPPGQPLLAAPADGDHLGAPTVVVQGVVDGESARVELREGAEVLQALAPARGAVAFELPSLAEGSHTWSLVAVDAAGNRSAPSNAVTVVVDRTAPLAAAIASPAAGAHLAAAAVTVRGTAEPGATVLVVCDGGEAASAVAEADGAFAAALALPDGARTVTVQVRDAAGNLSEATERAFTVDTLAPAAPAVLAPAQGATLPPGAIEVRGTAEPGALVTVALAGASGAATAGEDGAWSMELTLPVGTHGIHATATDAASNVSPATEVTVVGRVDDGAGGGGGCGCRTGSGGGAPALLALAGLLALAPRPRRRGA